MKRLGAAQALPGLAVLLLLILAASPVLGGARMGRDQPRPSTSTATSGRSSPRRASSATGPTRPSARRSLRLDTREGAFADAGRRAGHRPRQARGERARRADHLGRPRREDAAAEVGPVAHEGPDRDLIRRWIEQGAEWKGHWSYIPPARPTCPDARRRAGRVRPQRRRPLRPREARREGPDALARGRPGHADPPPQLRPDRPAARRRARSTSSSTTRPPTPTRRWSTGCSPRRTSASGWRSHWLDLVRYADTIGYHGDNHRDVALYRDYVIDAFNTNMPFDRFTIEQLAGDLLPGPTDAQRIASGYNQLLMTTQEGGAQAKEYLRQVRRRPRAERLDRLDGRDPRLRRVPRPQVRPVHDPDFYRFAAFFADIQEVAVGEPGAGRRSRPRSRPRSGPSSTPRSSRLKAVLTPPRPPSPRRRPTWERTSPGATATIRNGRC